MNPRLSTSFGRREPAEGGRLSRWQRGLQGLSHGLLRILLLAAAVALAGLFLFPSSAHAGRSCEQARPTPERIARGMQLADRIETVTADSVFAWLPRNGLAAAVTLAP